MRGKQWNCLTLQVLVNNHRLVWSYGNCADQCHNWNMIILLSFKQKRFQGFFWIIFLQMLAFKLSECYTYYLYLLICYHCHLIPSLMQFGLELWKKKTFPFEPRTLLVNDPLFVYFNVYFMTFVVLNAHWLNLLLSTWWKHYLMKKTESCGLTLWGSSVGLSNLIRHL